MISYNRVILTGRVTAPPRRHYRPDGSPVIQFPLELNGQEGPPEAPPIHRGTGQASRGVINIVAFGQLAEFKFDLLQSGQRLLVVGRLNPRRWQTPEGQNRTRVEVIATDLRKVEEIIGPIDLFERGEEDEETH